MSFPYNNPLGPNPPWSNLPPLAPATNLVNLPQRPFQPGTARTANRSHPRRTVLGLPPGAYPPHHLQPLPIGSESRPQPMQIPRQPPQYAQGGHPCSFGSSPSMQNPSPNSLPDRQQSQYPSNKDLQRMTAAEYQAFVTRYWGSTEQRAPGLSREERQLYHQQLAQEEAEQCQSFNDPSRLLPIPNRNSQPVRLRAQNLMNTGRRDGGASYGLHAASGPFGKLLAPSPNMLSVSQASPVGSAYSAASQPPTPAQRNPSTHSFADRPSRFDSQRNPVSSSVGGGRNRGTAAGALRPGDLTGVEHDAALDTLLQNSSAHALHLRLVDPGSIVSGESAIFHVTMAVDPNEAQAVENMSMDAATYLTNAASGSRIRLAMDEPGSRGSVLANLVRHQRRRQAQSQSEQGQDQAKHSRSAAVPSAFHGTREDPDFLPQQSRLDQPVNNPGPSRFDFGAFGLDTPPDVLQDFDFEALTTADGTDDETQNVKTEQKVASDMKVSLNELSGQGDRTPEEYRRYLESELEKLTEVRVRSTVAQSTSGPHNGLKREAVAPTADSADLSRGSERGGTGGSQFKRMKRESSTGLDFQSIQEFKEEPLDLGEVTQTVGTGSSGLTGIRSKMIVKSEAGGSL